MNSLFGPGRNTRRRFLARCLGLSVGVVGVLYALPARLTRSLRARFFAPRIVTLDRDDLYRSHDLAG